MAKSTIYTCDGINSNGTDCEKKAKWYLQAEVVNATPGRAPIVVHVNGPHACESPTHLGEVAANVLGDTVLAQHIAATKYGGNDTRGTQWQLSGVIIRKVPKET